MLALWEMAGRAAMRRDDVDEVEEDGRNEMRRADEREKGTAIFLNIEEGESNAAAFDRLKLGGSSKLLYTWFARKGNILRNPV